MVRRVQYQPSGSIGQEKGKEKGFCDCASSQETLLVSLDRPMVKQKENLLLMGKRVFFDHYHATALQCLSCSKASSSLERKEMPLLSSSRLCARAQGSPAQEVPDSPGSFKEHCTPVLEQINEAFNLPEHRFLCLKKWGNKHSSGQENCGH